MLWNAQHHLHEFGQVIKEFEPQFPHPQMETIIATHRGYYEDEMNECMDNSIGLKHSKSSIQGRFHHYHHYCLF